MDVNLTPHEINRLDDAVAALETILLHVYMPDADFKQRSEVAADARVVVDLLMGRTHRGQRHP
jgi:hypothetical protein